MNHTTLETETFLDRLRNITSQSHKELENLPLSLSIISPGVSIKEYSQYLFLMHDVIKDVEENILPQLSTAIPDISERKKVKLIENDLNSLGITKSEYKRAMTEDKQAFSEAFAMGILYVIEGSTLGGRYILKNINDVLGYDEGYGAQYFAGYGNSTGSRWKNFINLLKAYEDEHENGNEIIEGATFAFERISAHFIQNTPQ